MIDLSFSYPDAIYMFLWYSLKVQCAITGYGKLQRSKSFNEAGMVKLQGQMVSPSSVGGKDVMSPPPTFELKGEPKLAIIHTCTVCVWHTANEHSIKEQCCMNISMHHGPQTDIYSYVHTDKAITICITV